VKDGRQKLETLMRKLGNKHEDLILMAFITGNNSLEPLLEGLLVQIHIDLS